MKVGGLLRRRWDNKSKRMKFLEILKKEKEMEHTNNPKELPALCFAAIFEGKQFCYRGMFQARTETARKKLRCLNIGDYLYIEQNRRTKSKYAQSARAGKKIMWVIHKPTGKYILRVTEEGVVRLPGLELVKRWRLEKKLKRGGRKK